MVVLSRSFTILASLSTLAAVSVLPVSVSGAPLPSPARHAPPHANRHPNNGRNHGTNGAPSHTPDARGQDAAPAGVQGIGGLTDSLNGASSGLSSIGVPSLPLPPRSLDSLIAPLAGAPGLPSLPLPPRALKFAHTKTHVKAAEDHAGAGPHEKSRHEDKVRCSFLISTSASQRSFDIARCLGPDESPTSVGIFVYRRQTLLDQAQRRRYPIWKVA